MSAEPVGPRPRTRLPAIERRQVILRAARRLFADQGYDATTTRQIATAAGVTDAMIYRHFASKDDLLLALVDDLLERFAAMAAGSGSVVPRIDSTGRTVMAARQADGAPTTDALQAQLVGLGTTFVTTLAEHADLIVLLVSQRRLLGDDRRFVEFVDEAARRLGARLESVTAAGDDGIPDRGYLLARAYMGALAALVLLNDVLEMDVVHPLDRTAYITALSHTLLAGLGWRDEQQRDGEQQGRQGPPVEPSIGDGGGQ